MLTQCTYIGAIWETGKHYKHKFKKKNSDLKLRTMKKQTYLFVCYAALRHRERRARRVADGERLSTVTECTSETYIYRIVKPKGFLIRKRKYGF